MRKIVLASQSSWRKKILEQIGLEFEVCVSDYEEDMAAITEPYELVKFLSLEKGKDVAKKYDDAIIISGDTFVVHEGKFIGKPHTPEKAKETLKSLSGVEHSIISGFAIIDTKNSNLINDYGEAKVKFRDLSDEEIDEYIATGEPLDKAGAYGLAVRGATLVEGISGDYYSVIGLPLSRIYVELRKMGVNPFRK